MILAWVKTAGVNFYIRSLDWSPHPTFREIAIGKKEGVVIAPSIFHASLRHYNNRVDLLHV